MSDTTDTTPAATAAPTTTTDSPYAALLAKLDLRTKVRLDNVSW